MTIYANYKLQSGVSHTNNTSPSYANNWNFGQPCTERPNSKLWSIHPHLQKYTTGIILKFGQWIAIDNDPDNRFKTGDILIQQDERARLRREQRNLFDKAMSEVFAQPSAFMKANTNNTNPEYSKPFWMDMSTPSTSIKHIKI